MRLVHCIQLLCVFLFCAALSQLAWAQTEAQGTSALQQQLSKLQAVVRASQNQTDTSGSADAQLALGSTTSNTTDAPPSIAQGNEAATPEASTGAPPQITDLRQNAFVGMTNEVLPLSPKQIKTLHQLFNAVQKAAGSYPGIPPRPTSSARKINLSPGATPPVIRLQSGFVTSLVFSDATGASWPITAYDIGDSRSFDVQWDKKSHILLVQALSKYKSGNIAVLLKGLDTPVMVTLSPGQKAVDYRVDLRVPRLGPNAKAGYNGMPSTANPMLLNVLNGLSPSPNARQLDMPGCPSCSLWSVHGKFYLRTQHTLLSPSWLGTVSSSDGTHAYELVSTPVILISRHGKTVSLAVDGL